MRDCPPNETERRNWSQPLAGADATTTAARIRAGADTARGITDRALQRIRTGARIGAFWNIEAASALEDARDIDRNAGLRDGPLLGASLAVKDCFDVAGLPTSGGVRGVHPAAKSDAATVMRLRLAGCVPLGKVAMHQLGWSAEPTPVGFAPTMNPVDETLAVGGSSSGSAAAVAAGMAHLALGTDTAGSVRIPAAYCGVVGFKPRVGDVPSDGFLQTTRSFDAIGVLARSVRDCAAAYEAFADRPIPLLDHDKGVSPRIAVLEDLFAPCDQDIVEALRPALEYLGERHTMRPQRVDWQPVGYLRLLAAEFADRWGDTIVPDTELYCPDVIESIAFGKRVAPEHDHLMRRLAEDRVAVAERLSSCDVLVAPVVPHSVPLKGAEPTLGRTIEIVRIFSALDWPAISVPVGVDRSGRPASLQLAAHPDNLQSLFHVALSFDAYEPSCNGTHR